jgi:Xaa-Pro dipeptidase
MRGANVDAIVAASPGLVAFLTGHVMPANLAYPSRDARVGQPTTAVVTVDAVATVARAPNPTVGETFTYERAELADADAEAAFDALRAAIVQLGLGKATVAFESGQMPAASLAAIRASAPDAALRPLGDLLVEAKATKSDAELEGIREACALTDAAHAAIRAAVRVGVSELELYAEAVAAMNGMSTSAVLSGCELMTGPRTVDPGGPPVPTGRKVRAGDLVVSDVYPRHPNGWWGDTCSTVSCGEPSDDLRRGWRRLMDALEAGRERLRPGLPVREVYDAIRSHAGEQVPYVGHSIGRDHFEEPVVRAGSEETLPAGGVIVLEPGYVHGEQAIRLEWAYRISEEGGLPLTSFSLEL